MRDSTYEQTEKEIIEMFYHVLVNDEQLDVCSTHIADLILRIATEIETIAKEIYWKNGGEKQNPKFDYDCIDGISGIEDKTVLVVSSRVELSPKNRVIHPLRKTEVKLDRDGNKILDKDGNEIPICSWNNAYQSLKHDKTNTLVQFGTLRYLLSAFAAYYILLNESRDSSTLSDIVVMVDGDGGYWKPGRGLVRAQIEDEFMPHLSE